jgi:hypothetical protein
MGKLRMNKRTLRQEEGDAADVTDREEPQGSEASRLPQMVARL